MIVHLLFALIYCVIGTNVSICSSFSS